MDLVSKVVRAARVGTPGSRVIRQYDSQGIRFSAFEGTGFHVVLRGTCWLLSEDQDPVGLEPGDVVLVTSGAPHGLSRVPCALHDLPSMAVRPAAPRPGPFDFEFLCGVYQFQQGRTPQYFRALPDLITLSPDYDRSPRTRALIDLLSAETSEADLGAAAALPALLDLILIHVLRQWHEQQGSAEWPRTDDPEIAAALREIHKYPQRRWTVTRLSDVVGLPRTVFTRRFTEGVGRPPMSYLTSWRLSLGARALRETDATLATIAREVGYSTEFAFSGAFTREYGVSPGRFRRSTAALIPPVAD